jgi:hypothetical protein
VEGHAPWLGGGDEAALLGEGVAVVLPVFPSLLVIRAPLITLNARVARAVCAVVRVVRGESKRKTQHTHSREENAPRRLWRQR